MLRLSTLILSVILSTAALAQAQTPAPPIAERRVITPEQRARFQADRQACVSEVKPQSLPRGERRKAMRGCMEAKNPELKQFFARGETRRAELRQIRNTCRTEINAKGIKRPERREAMQSCIVAKKPEMAKVFSCVEDARKKGLQPGGERRDFMRTCLRG